MTRGSRAGERGPNADSAPRGGDAVADEGARETRGRARAKLGCTLREDRSTDGPRARVCAAASASLERGDEPGRKDEREKSLDTGRAPSVDRRSSRFRAGLPTSQHIKKVGTSVMMRGVRRLVSYRSDLRIGPSRLLALVYLEPPRPFAVPTVTRPSLSVFTAPPRPPPWAADPTSAGAARRVREARGTTHRRTRRRRTASAWTVAVAANARR